MTCVTSLPTSVTIRSTESAPKSHSANAPRDSELFFQRSIYKEYNSSALHDLYDERAWILFDTTRLLGSYRNMLSDWTSFEKIGHSNVPSAGHLVLDNNLEDFVRRIHDYTCVWWEEPVKVFEEFQQLAAIWKDETRLASSVTDIVFNRHYLQIIGMGKAVIPYILQNLQKEPNHWFHALRSVTRENPVPPEDRGDMQAMANAWLSWGKDKGFI